MRAQSMNMEDKICRVIIPEQTVVEEKDGVQKEKIKKLVFYTEMCYFIYARRCFYFGLKENL